MAIKIPFLTPFILILITEYDYYYGVSSFSLPPSSTIQIHRHPFRIHRHPSIPSSPINKSPFSFTASTRESNLEFKSLPKKLLANAKQNSNDGDDGNSSRSDSNKASVSFSSTITPPTSQELSTPTAIIDYLISILISDLGSIIIGSIGLLLALYNRLSTIDFDSNVVSPAYAEAINIQSRNDLLAVFASGAVLLNGLSKLDVTSVLAESVSLNGVVVEQPLFVKQENNEIELTKESREDLKWAMESILTSTPAKTAVLLTTSTIVSKIEAQSKSKWIPIVFAGIVPSTATTDKIQLPMDHSTPILDRFLKQDNAKESYLPTLQALPGKVEFTYLPDNAQEALLLPIDVTDRDNTEGNGSKKIHALVVGSDTAKSFTPRDVAWCQVLAQRIGNKML